ncbi:hypothetical protein Tco_0466108, partial [Tanacetum coccineum]
LVSQLAILGVVTDQEDLNSKFLRSLPAEWNTHVVLWMNKPDLDIMAIDDLYNNFKIVEQQVKKATGASSSIQNMAFVSAPSTRSNYEVNTISSINTAGTSINTGSSKVNVVYINDSTAYAFMVANPNGSQLLHQDLEQIFEDDLEAMDLKWQLLLLSMRFK